MIIDMVEVGIHAHTHTHTLTCTHTHTDMQTGHKYIYTQMHI